jgi:platelet-activating factor acetylhydrolase
MGIASSQLPAYSGPHTVGIHDVEVSLSKPEVFGTSLSAETGEHAFQLETVLFSLYYPCTPNHSRPSYPYWLERPISQITSGYTRFANRAPSNRIYAYIFVCINWIIGARLVIPAIQSAELKRNDEEGNKQWPVMVFSHGLAGNRKCYSQYCGEMASRGYIVAAMEHRDGTAPYTRILGRDGAIKRDLQWIDPKILQYVGSYIARPIY